MMTLFREEITPGYEESVVHYNLMAKGERQKAKGKRLILTFLFACIFVVSHAQQFIDMLGIVE